METWQTQHAHAEHEDWTCTITWRWSGRAARGEKLPRGQYRAKPIALEFSVFTPELEADALTRWIQER